MSSFVLRTGLRPLVAISLLVLAAPALAQSRNPQEPRNLARNGGFENPPVSAGGSASLAAAGAWSATAGALVLRAGPPADTAYEGTQSLALASLAVVRQTCATRPGASYALSLAWRAASGAGATAFELWYAGVLLETVSVPAGAPWQHTSHLVTGVTSGDGIELRSLEPSANGVLIDDVFLMPHDTTVTAQLLRNNSLEEDPRLDPDTSMSNPVFVGWYALQGTVEVKDLGASGSGFSGKHVIDLDEARSVAQRVFVVPDRSYSLRVAWSPNPLDDRDRSFTVSFAGRLLDTIAVPRSGAIAWSTRTYAVTSESPVAELELRDLGGGTNGTLLDALTLNGVVPEPETDGQITRYSILRHNTAAGIRLSTNAMFARGITALGDVDGDGVQDLAVGSVGDDDGAPNAGAVWIVFLNRDRTPKGSRKISEFTGGLVADFADSDGFGRALSGLGDLDGDGVPDLCVGANEEDEPDSNSGAVYVLFLNRDGTVKGQHKISAQSGDPLAFVPRRGSEFGGSVAGMGDVDGDGIPDVAIGARFSNSVQVCFLRRDGTVRSARNLTYGQNGFTDRASSFADLFGMSCANMGDFDGDGVNDLLVGAFGREYLGMDFVGGQYLLLLNRDGTCKRWFYYGAELINPRTQTLGLHYDLGTACAGPGDVDGDGVLDLMSGAQREGSVSGFDRTEGSKKGAVYLLLLNANGSIKTVQRIGDRAGGWDYTVNDGARIGESLAALGDLDGNGLVDVAIGSRFDFSTGAAFLCELGNRAAVPLVADFSGAPLSGPAPLTVAFTDLSTGSIAARAWTFGDGATSGAANPSRTYANPGTYTVALTVTGEDGTSQTRTRAGYVVVTEASGLPPGVQALGCGINPAGSFRLLS
ncbi:MAG TPA: FG-GAP-like repeat-containing protein, partial [Planctomycetota bacterium]